LDNANRIRRRRGKAATTAPVGRCRDGGWRTALPRAINGSPLLQTAIDKMYSLMRAAQTCGSIYGRSVFGFQDFSHVTRRQRQARIDSSAVVVTSYHMIGRAITAKPASRYRHVLSRSMVSTRTCSLQRRRRCSADAAEIEAAAKRRTSGTEKASN
jgi:hypothetical protein